MCRREVFFWTIGVEGTKSGGCGNNMRDGESYVYTLIVVSHLRVAVVFVSFVGCATSVFLIRGVRSTSANQNKTF